MFRRKRVELTEEEILFVKYLFNKETKKRSREIPAIPKDTLFPGFLTQSTIIALEDMGCRVRFVDHQQGHAVATPPGARYRPFMELIRDMEPNGKYAREAYSQALRTSDV